MCFILEMYVLFEKLLTRRAILETKKFLFLSQNLRVFFPSPGVFYRMKVCVRVFEE